jgi:hypothetical protein
MLKLQVQVKTKIDDDRIILRSLFNEQILSIILSSSAIVPAARPLYRLETRVKLGGFGHRQK